MEKLVLYKYSSEEECNIIKWILTSTKKPYYLFTKVVNSYCYKEHINSDEFNTYQTITLYTDALRDLVSHEPYDEYLIISNNTLELIKDKLRDLDVPFISIVSLNIGCEEINTLPF